MDKIKKQIYNYIDNPLNAGVNFDTVHKNSQNSAL